MCCRKQHDIPSELVLSLCQITYRQTPHPKSILDKNAEFALMKSRLSNAPLPILCLLRLLPREALRVCSVKNGRERVLHGSHVGLRQQSRSSLHGP